MSTIDRVIRLAVAVIVAVLFFTGHISGLAAIILGILAAVFALTSTISFCPVYTALNISTRRTAEA